MFTFVLLAAVVTNDPSPRYDVVNLVPVAYDVVNRVPPSSLSTPVVSYTITNPVTGTVCVGGLCGASAVVGLGYARGFAGFARPFRRR